VGKFWFFRGHLNEGRATLREVLAQAERIGLPSRPSAGYAKALHAAALMDQGQGDYASGDKHLTTALAMWRQLDEPLEAAYELFVLGRSELWRGNREAARPLFLESLELAGQAGNAAVVGRNQLWLAEAAFDDGDDDAARAWAEQASVRRYHPPSARPSSDTFRWRGRYSDLGRLTRPYRKVRICRRRKPLLRCWICSRSRSLVRAERHRSQLTQPAHSRRVSETWRRSLHGA